MSHSGSQQCAEPPRGLSFCACDSVPVTRPGYKEIVIVVVDAKAGVRKEKRKMVEIFRLQIMGDKHTMVARRWGKRKARAQNPPSRERRNARARASRAGWTVRSRSTGSIGLGMSSCRVASLGAGLSIWVLETLRA
jgi:hypothetical protein